MYRRSYATAKPSLLPKPDDLVLHLMLDEGVPDAVGRVFEERGHVVTFGNRSLPRGSPDQLVCVAAMNAGAILVAADHDMRTIARAHGLGNERYKSLNLLKLSCRKPEAAEKVKQAMSLIEHEWQCNEAAVGRRLFMELSASVIRINR
jgi:predicted nuclease of predicted toxin-antitoxin system